jgi:hypothetical protein
MAKTQNKLNIAQASAAGGSLAQTAADTWTVSPGSQTSVGIWGANGTSSWSNQVTKGNIIVASSSINMGTRRNSVNDSILRVETSQTSTTANQTGFFKVGGWTNIASTLWPSTSIAAFTSGITSTYNNYCVVLSGLKPGSDVNMLLQTSVDGSTWVTSGYSYGGVGVKSASGVASTFTTLNSSASGLNLLGSALSKTSTNTMTEGIVTFTNPSGSGYPSFTWSFSGFTLNGANQDFYTINGSGVNPVAAAIVGVRFILDSGSMSGTPRLTLYGQTKTS